MKELRVDELAAHCASSPESVLLDVREPWEVALASIRLPGVVHRDIPLGSLAQRLGELDPSTSIVCICHHGVRSRQVVAFLDGQGWPSVYNLRGGVDAWSCDVDPAVPRY